MKITHRFCIPAALLAAALTPVQAQTAPAAAAQPVSVAPPAQAAQVPHPFAFRQALEARIFHSLHLTKAQRAQLKGIRTQTAAAIKAARADTTVSPGQRQAKVAALMQDGRRQLRGTLTIYQREKLDRIRRQVRRLQRMLD